MTTTPAGYEVVNIDGTECLRYTGRHARQPEPDPQTDEIGAGVTAYMDAHPIRGTEPTDGIARVIAGEDEDRPAEDAQ